MEQILYYTLLFMAMISVELTYTANVILIQRNQCLLAWLSIVLSNFIYYGIIRDIAASGSYTVIAAVSIASGVGVSLAAYMGDKLAKDRTAVNVIMSEDKDAAQKLRDFLTEHSIYNVATLDVDVKTITVTAYAETKQDNLLISRYIEDSNSNFKRVVCKAWRQYK